MCHNVVGITTVYWCRWIYRQMEQNKKYRNRPVGYLIRDKGDCNSERTDGLFSK